MVVPLGKPHRIVGKIITRAVVVHLGHYVRTSVEFRHHHESVNNPDGMVVGRRVWSTNIHYYEVSVAYWSIVRLFPDLKVAVGLLDELYSLEHTLVPAVVADEASYLVRLLAELTHSLNLVYIEDVLSCSHECLDVIGWCFVEHLRSCREVKLLVPVPVDAFKGCIAFGPQIPVVLARHLPFAYRSVVVLVLYKPLDEGNLVLNRQRVMRDALPANEDRMVARLSPFGCYVCVMEIVIRTLGS